jgi:hypothetical protein
MATTPEGEEKKKVREFLDSIGAYHYWPVQTGVGTDTLDCLACIRRHHVHFGHGATADFWGIEVKRADGPISKRTPTKRQLIRMEEIEKAGGRCVSGPADTIIAILKAAIGL